MDEELLSGTASSEGSRGRDVQLIERYCAGLEERIAAATSPHDAAAIVEASCQAFDNECESTLLRTHLREYLDDLLERHWGIQP